MSYKRGVRVVNLVKLSDPDINMKTDRLTLIAVSNPIWGQNTLGKCSFIDKSEN